MAGEQEVQDQTEEQAAASLAEGFEEAAPQAQPVTTQPVSEGEPAAVVQPDDEVVQVTRRDLNRLMAAADKAETIDVQMSKVFGTIGNVKNELMNRLTASAAAGGAIEISDDDFAELQEDFPELAKHTKAAFERILKRGGLRGTGDPATAQINTDEIVSRADALRREDGLKELSFLRPDWRQIVGFTAEGQADPDSEYRKWLAAQPAEYQETVRNTNSARITDRSIEEFLEHKAAKTRPTTSSPAPNTDVRRARINGAVQPTGTGTRPAPTRPTPEDEFRQGFASG